MHKQRRTELDLQRSTRIQTPAPSPLKVLTIPGELHEDLSVDPFHPLDYTNHERSPADLRISTLAAAAAAAINTLDEVDDLSISSSQSEQTVGEKGGSISDAEVNHSDSKDPTYNPVGEKGGSISDAKVNDSDSKDPTYNPLADFNDDDLFYSEDEDLDAALDRE